MAAKGVKKIVLAYSGGLDTSVILRWLQQTYRCEVVTFTADLGQGEELEPARRKAEMFGITEIFVEDLRETFVKDFVFPMFRANALYEGQYLLGTSIARPLIAQRQIEIAEQVGADAVAHGATGKGNDQVRFELAYYALNPDVKVIAPWREWDLTSRTRLLAFAEAREGAGFVYLNPPDHVAEGLRLATRHRLHPSYAIYEPGFLRLGAAMAAAAHGLPAPIYRLMFSDEFAWGLPPAPAFLDAYLALLAREAPAGVPWMVAGLGVDITPLIAPAVAAGGHVRVGLEDAPWGSSRSNRAWVEAALHQVTAAGGAAADAASVRAALARPAAAE